MREPTEADFDTILAWLQQKDPQFDLRVEFGQLLMKHINDLTPEESKRYDELQQQLKPIA